jgi:hypothetical protein
VLALAGCGSPSLPLFIIWKILFLIFNFF